MKKCPVSRLFYGDIGVFNKQGYHHRGPHNKDCSIVGFILAYPNLGKLPSICIGTVSLYVCMQIDSGHLGKYLVGAPQP